MESLSLLSDIQLWKLVQQDAEPAFAELYERYWQMLFGMAFKRLQSKEGAEEVVQEAFLMIWQKRHSINIDAFPQYLSAVVKYAIFHELAKIKKVKASIDNLSTNTFSNSVEQELEYKMLMRLVALTANELPHKCRLVFKYNKQQGLPLPEVAAEMNISIKTAEAHLTKALKYIRLKLGHHFYYVITFLYLFINK